MAEPAEVLAKQLHEQLFEPVEMANQASVAGMVVLSCLLLLGLLLMAWLSAGQQNKAESVHSENSHSFHESSRHTMRSTSPSLISGLSVGNSSHISSISQLHHMSGPKSLPLSIISCMSRGTMTSVNKSTMTEGLQFSLEEELKRMNLLDKYTPSRMGSIVNTADITIIQEKQIERKDSSNTESFAHRIIDNNFSLCSKKSSVDSETNTTFQGLPNGAFEDEEEIADATRRCSDYVNNNCSGRRRKFEPKYATITKMQL